SPSIVTMYRPRALSNPAANAAVCPKFRRNRMMRSRASTACICARTSKLSSVLPSSTTMISYDRSQRVSVSVSSRTSSGSDDASFRIGMTTLKSIRCFPILSAFAASRFGQGQIHDKAAEEETHRRQRDGDGVRVHERERTVPVLHGEDPEQQVPRPASN